ncbi:Panacea domain-containing protein [Rhizobium sp. TRM95796]|uniref:Panacea domain-containing protein n=1 Tax=Rhizobium sp. TRM95796 TaxID=2979862 RepID=UPI0021E92A66|nr:Panacea domain-containing protein [Rhizobium sp. TRM95796]MCV3765655.1 Panacea domain-containing protein [Rhizobium sp. TRM95796]
MPNHDARAIANEFLRRRDSDTWPKQLPIQKLTYIAHGWNLAINGEPLIDEVPQAWDNGPVFRSVWNHIKDFGYRGKKYTLLEPVSGEEITANLTPGEKAIIDHVWKKYGSKSSVELSDMTHQVGTPWYKAYFGNRKNAPLSNDDIKDHYIKLALAGRVKDA